MKISELIKKLQSAKKAHGDLEVWVSGAYSSETDDIYNLEHRDVDLKKLRIQTDLMTGWSAK